MRFNGLGGGTQVTGINGSTYTQVVISVVEGVVSWTIGGTTYTMPNPTNQTTLYFACKAGKSSNMYLQDFSVSTTHNVLPSDETTGGGAITSGEGTPHSNFAVHEFVEDDWTIKNFSTSPMTQANGGTRLWIPKGYPTESLLCSGKPLLYHGMIMSVYVYMYQANLEKESANMRVGLSTNTSNVTYGNLEVLGQYFQEKTTGKIIDQNDNRTTTTGYIPPVYTPVHFIADNEGNLSIALDEETPVSTGAVIPSTGAYLFLTNYNMPLSMGVSLITYTTGGGKLMKLSIPQYHHFGSTTSPWTDTIYKNLGNGTHNIKNEGQTLQLAGSLVFGIRLTENFTFHTRILTTNTNYTMWCGINHSYTEERLSSYIQYTTSGTIRVSTRDTEYYDNNDTSKDYPVDSINETIGTSVHSLRVILRDKHVYYQWDDTEFDTGYTVTSEQLEEGLYIAMAGGSNVWHMGNTYFTDD